MSYDKLMVATGATPITPPIAGLDLNGVYRLAHPHDAVALGEASKDATKERAVIVGGGLIGLELVDALCNRDKEVVLIEMADQLLPGILDWEIAALVARHLRRQGVEVLTSHRLERFEGDEQGNLKTVVADGEHLSADLAVMGIGVRPNISLAREAGLAIGQTGAIEVDANLRTSDPDIFAGGDCVENVHLVSGQKVFVPLGSTANRHGRIIGDNIVGGNERFPGVLGTMVLQTLDLNIGRTGLTESEAQRMGFDVVTSTVAAFDCAHYYPSHASMVLKLVADRATGRLLGAQGVGEGEVVKRIDVLATTISLGGHLEDLAGFDLGYAPPFSSAIDIVAHAANLARNKSSKLAKGMAPAELKDLIAKSEPPFVLDVRTTKEVKSEKARVGQTVNIPLGELRTRLGELPRDVRMVAICQMGTRSYEAQVLLEGHGFSDVSFLEGGLLSWPYEGSVS